VRVTLLLLSGCRALDAQPADPSAVAESFMLKLLSLSGFHPSLTACAVCGAPDPQLWLAGLGGAVCASCAEPGAGTVSRAALEHLSRLAPADLQEAGGFDPPDPRVRRESRALLYGFAEYHFERRMKSVPMLVRTAP
jgi:DNA repair protein RecO (recombination protein O)